MSDFDKNLWVPRAEPFIPGYRWSTNLRPAKPYFGGPTDSIPEFDPPLTMDEVAKRYAAWRGIPQDKILVRKATSCDGDYAIYIKKEDEETSR